MNEGTRTLTRDERLAWLRLIRSENVGPITFFQLLKRFGNAAGALEALPEMSLRGGRRRAIKVCAKANALAEMEAIEASDALLVAYGEPDYPALLGHIADPPPLIVVAGQLPLLGKPMIAMVGARNASANGMRLTQRLAGELGEAGFVVVSGLARGIDTAAHGGALTTGTVAAVAGGVDVVYPPENADLQEEIKTHGAILSEMPPGTVPQARHFPRRNRIVAGLALGTVVVEAAPRSGSLITARLAGEQGRVVLAVPGSPLDPRHRGTNALIRTGATLVQNANDVIEAVSPLIDPHRLQETTVPPIPPLPAVPSDADLDAARHRIHALLDHTPIPIDDLIRQTGLTPAVILTILLELELAGRLDRHPGNEISLR